MVTNCSLGPHSILLVLFWFLFSGTWMKYWQRYCHDKKVFVSPKEAPVMGRNRAQLYILCGSTSMCFRSSRMLCFELTYQEQKVAAWSSALGSSAIWHILGRINLKTRCTVLCGKCNECFLGLAIWNESGKQSTEHIYLFFDGPQKKTELNLGEGTSWHCTGTAFSVRGMFRCFICCELPFGSLTFYISPRNHLFSLHMTVYVISVYNEGGKCYIPEHVIQVLLYGRVFCSLWAVKRRLIFDFKGERKFLAYSGVSLLT